MCKTFPPNKREVCRVARASIKVGSENRLRWMEEMEKRSDRHIRDLVALSAFQGLDANEIGCARISMMAGSKNGSLQRAEYR
jgi:hypothetical protein